MKEFTDLQVWQEAHKLTLMVYQATRKWPTEELFGLTVQTRKAVSSVEFNIAEGHGRFSDAEFRHHCNIAHGSLSETQSQLMVARDLDYMTLLECQPIHAQSVIVCRQLRALMRRLRPG
jgi:four helix bundle protein